MLVCCINHVLAKSLLALNLITDVNGKLWVFHDFCLYAQPWSGVPSLCFCTEMYSSKFWDNLISITHHMDPASMWVNTYTSEWESCLPKSQGPYRDKRRVAKSPEYLYWHISASCIASNEERLISCLLPTHTSFMFCPVGHLACFLLHTQCWAFISGYPFWFYHSWLLPL